MSILQARVRDSRSDLTVCCRFSITFCGKAYSEETLISVAYAFEQLTQVREKIQPIRVPQTELSDVM